MSPPSALCVAMLFVVDASGERRDRQGFRPRLCRRLGARLRHHHPGHRPGARRNATPSRPCSSSVAALAGIGLAAIASVEAAGRTRRRRLMSLGLLARRARRGRGVAVPAMPGRSLCEPRSAPARTLWLDHIDEAQSLFKLVADDPASVAARYATPLVAIVLMALRLRRGGWRRQDSLVGALLVVAFAVSVWQVRGSTFSIAFAVIPLSAWIANMARAGRGPARRAASSLRMAAAWLVSVNVVWTGAAAAASAALRKPTQTPPSDARRRSRPASAKASFAPLGPAARHHRACHLQPRLADPGLFRTSRLRRTLSSQHRRKPACARCLPRIA